MAQILKYAQGEEIPAIRPEGTEPAFYFLREGWVEVQPLGEGGQSAASYVLGPGSIIAELGFFSVRRRFRGSLRARTDVAIEVVDRGLLTRWIGASGARLVPVLWALTRRMEDVLFEDEGPSLDDDTVVAWASIHGADEQARTSMGGRPVLVDRLPFTIGAHRIPQSVGELFHPRLFSDLMLVGELRMVRPQHLRLELDEQKRLFLRVTHFGDWCEVDGTDIGRHRVPGAVLPRGAHEIRFGDPSHPFHLRIKVFR